MFDELLQKLYDIKPPILLVRRIITPDGTALRSRFNHDYVAHRDANGENYFLDGGITENSRTSINEVKAVNANVYSNSPYQEIRTLVERSGRGKCGTKPLKYVPHYKMSNSWLEACITYEEQATRPGVFYRNLFILLYQLELAYREKYNIFISDEDEEKDWEKIGF